MQGTQVEAREKAETARNTANRNAPDVSMGEGAEGRYHVFHEYDVATCCKNTHSAVRNGQVGAEKHAFAR